MTSLTADQLLALERLRTLFAALPDSRQRGKVAYPIEEVLMIALCAMLADFGDFTGMELFARNQQAWLRTFLPLASGTPSHDVFRNVFMALKPEAFAGVLAAWSAGLSGRHVAIDGKTLRGSREKASGKAPVHLVRAWVDACGLSAGHVTCAEKSNEVEAIPRLLDALQLEGAIVTIDAAGTQCAIAEKIHAAGADYVLSLKANQKSALAAVEGFFATAPRAALKRRTTLEKRHGRCERREYSMSADLSWFNKSWKWPGLRTVARVRRVIQRDHTGPPATEVHYYLSSLPLDVKRLATLVRAHWSVENRCHWVLDVVFDEDHCQVRDATAARNLSVLREISLKALRDEPSKRTLRLKRKLAAIDPAYRLNLLLALHA